MEPIESSETSAYNNTLTPGTYPKEKKLLLWEWLTHFSAEMKTIWQLHAALKWHRDCWGHPQSRLAKEHCHKTSLANVCTRRDLTSYNTECISCMSLIVNVNTIAECLRTDRNILGDNKKKRQLMMNPQIMTITISAPPTITRKK